LFSKGFAQTILSLAVVLYTAYWEGNMSFSQLDMWLTHIRDQHKQPIDLGLERVRQVAADLNLLNPLYAVITVGGTNGKGSTVAGLEASFLAARRYRVGAFTSPYLYRFNELVRMNGVEVGDEDFIQAFSRIERARGKVTLTQFEFNTLAALDIFQRAGIDIAILEVGLGGRLDAVNIIDADVAVTTSIALDHTALLGDTRESIAREKAGIFRSDKPAVCGDFDPPMTLIDYAREINAPLFCQGKQFGFEKTASAWNWWSENTRLDDLPLPRLALQNMSTVLMVIELLQKIVPVRSSALHSALRKAHLPGRIQVIPDEVTRILDVSHNPAAAEFLAAYLRKNPPRGKIRAVFSMLADKDIPQTIHVIQDCIDEWHIAPLQIDRATPLPMLEKYFRESAIHAVYSYDSVKMAYHAAQAVATKGDCIVVFGSFHTVAACNI